MQIIFHSCGNVSKIIGDLIDAGVDVIEPLQPERWSLAQIARISRQSGVLRRDSDQRLTVLSPQEVKDQVRWTIDTLGKQFGNAYIVAPSNILLPTYRWKTCARCSKRVTSSKRQPGEVT